MRHKHYSGKQVTMVVPPNSTAMLCGTIYAHVYPDNRVVLTYSDGETESAWLTAERVAQGRESFFRLVSGVQDQRPNTLRHHQGKA